ncbi:MAG TPA: hypothetical protein VFX54_01210 [Candidatus Binatia bacterium]|nr:hypothetical protein [Candidatus Binatia bacterium]
MKTVNARDLQKRIKECVDVSPQDKVVITLHGKPAAVSLESKARIGRMWRCKPRRASGS